MEIPYRMLTVSGVTCSGVTTLTNKLSHTLNWPYRNPGSELGRKFLAEHNLPLSAMDQIPDTDEYNHDAQAKDLITNHNHIIVGGRLSGWLAHDVPGVFKIFVNAEKNVRIARYAKRENMPMDQARTEVEKREAAELAKYQRLYAVDARDPKWYDLVLDTSTTDPEACLQAVLQAVTA